jgi:RNA polymerase sigma factor (sigma-70 family)
MSRPPLTAEQQQMVENHLRFGYWVANRMRKGRWYPAMLLDRDELDAVCLYGICRAVSLFDVNRNVTFRTYAMHVLRSEVAKAALHSQAIRLPSTSFDARANAKGVQCVTMTDLSATITMEHIEKGNNEDESMIDKEDEIHNLHEYLSCLDDRSSLILELIYFERANLREISRLLGISHERVRQVKEKALTKLREMTLKKKTGIKNETGDTNACRTSRLAIARQESNYRKDGRTAPPGDTTGPGVS